MSFFISEDKAEILNTRIIAMSEPPGIETITITTGTVELRSNKSDRKSITIINDSSYFIYVGFTTSLTIGIDTITVQSGAEIHLNFLNDFNVYATLEEGTTTI